ncbi:MAG: MucR family transcriptional regulator, partial [Acidimicrobiia bacterium]
MRFEEPTWDGPYFGQFGVLADDGDQVQCHVCGEMFAHLGSHTNHSHGLTADEYRRAFGLMQSTKLIGPTFRAKRRQITADVDHDTLDVYGHLFEGIDQAAADAIDDSLDGVACGVAVGLVRKS